MHVARRNNAGDDLSGFRVAFFSSFPSKHIFSADNFIAIAHHLEKFSIPGEMGKICCFFRFGRSADDASLFDVRMILNFT